MEARARLIWNKSTAQLRRAQFAMGVGFESGLAIDAVASELIALLDIADLAALQGNGPDLASALIGIGERMFQIRPFIPEATLPDNWRDLLTSWLSGTDVAQIGIDNMRVVEEAFIYRLTWAAEALRMKRRADGGEPEHIEGSAAACLETGLPQSMMAMLVIPARDEADSLCDSHLA